MKHVSQNYKTGSIRLEEVPPPALKKGGVLVRTHFSVISAGTEGMKVKEGKMSYVQKAKARPDQVQKVVKTVQQQGLKAAYQKVMNKLDSLTPLGYSLAGVVEAVGAGAEEFQVGQRVAGAGVMYANHADINFIPKNLVVPVPDDVPLEEAAFSTIGAIAMQGMRQGDMQLGETACVIGLGLIGQLLVQLLRAGGIHVVGIDLVEDRCELAMELGADFAGAADNPLTQSTVARLTGGHGIDCIFLCAGGSSNKPVEMAVEMARDRARVVDIGKTRLDLPWKDYYEKELDVRFSRSYGPGRYDPNYEEGGIDYPIGYVRWTERRNMASFIALLAERKLRLGPIIADIRPFSEAETVYQEIADGKSKGLGLVFRYDQEEPPTTSAPTPISSSTPTEGAVRLGVIGAGNYASSMLLPHLSSNPDAHLATVATATSLSGANAVRKFQFNQTTTNYRELIESDEIDAILIATRHTTHASMAAEALRSGKAVFVEKPLALSLDECETVRQAAVESGNDRLLVGFNRRFSSLVQILAEQTGGGEIPLVIHYRVQAGQLDAGSWYLNPDEGSRFVGEAGHFIDVMSFLTRSRPKSVYAASLRPEQGLADDRDNLCVTITYDNGSVGTLQYLTQGGNKLPKEWIEVHGAAQSAQLQNFEQVLTFSATQQQKFRGSGIDKGQKEEMAAFIRAVRTASPMPISFDDLLDTTLVTLAAAESLKTGRVIPLASLWDDGPDA